MTRIAFHHLVGWLEHRIGDFSDGQLFMVGFFSCNERSLVTTNGQRLCRVRTADDGRVCGKRKMDAWVRNQVRLKFSEIDVECTIESQRCCDRADDLSDETIQVGVCWPFDVQIAAANIVDSL